MRVPVFTSGHIVFCFFKIKSEKTLRSVFKIIFRTHFHEREPHSSQHFQDFFFTRFHERKLTIPWRTVLCKHATENCVLLVSKPNLSLI
jgi:hypothetical protein